MQLKCSIVLSELQPLSFHPIIKLNPLLSIGKAKAGRYLFCPDSEFKYYSYLWHNLSIKQIYRTYNMKQYNFDETIERRGTNCVKFDLLKKEFGNEHLIPLWVADMDFRTPDFIVDAIKKRCEHEVFGYTFDSDSYYNSIIEWVHYKHNWKIRREWLSYIPGIVKGIGFVLQCFTRPGDKVIIQPPVYHPFRIVPESMHREVVYNPLKMVDGTYEMDLENLESVIDEHCKVLILCNPHNPGGIVWEKDTLARFVANITYSSSLMKSMQRWHTRNIRIIRSRLFRKQRPIAASHSWPRARPSILPES